MIMARANSTIGRAAGSYNNIKPNRLIARIALSPTSSQRMVCSFLLFFGPSFGVRLG